MNNTTYSRHRPGRIALRLRNAATVGFSLALVLALGTAAQSQAVVEQKIISNDARADDRIGRAVAISGDTVIGGFTRSATGFGSVNRNPMAANAQLSAAM